MNFKTYTILFIYNLCIILTWAALAVFFNHWWVALFGLLFITYPKFKYRRTCDCCGKSSEPADTALLLAKKAGWLHIENGNKDYCPDCRGRFE